MTDIAIARRPLVVVPRSSQPSEMIEVDRLASEPRAQDIGILVIAPRAMLPADLLRTCDSWPEALAQARVTRVAVVLGCASYLAAVPVLDACIQQMAEQGVEVAYFHEGHLESDQIRAWFEQRAPRRRVSSDTLVKLSERYAERGDLRSASHALRIAEAVAA